MSGSKYYFPEYVERLFYFYDIDYHEEVILELAKIKYIQLDMDKLVEESCEEFVKEFEESCEEVKDRYCKKICNCCSFKGIHFRYESYNKNRQEMKLAVEISYYFKHTKPSPQYLWCGWLSFQYKDVQMWTPSDHIFCPSFFKDDVMYFLLVLKHLKEIKISKDMKYYIIRKLHQSYRDDY